MPGVLEHIYEGARVALRSVHGKYLSAQPDGRAEWNRDHASTWEHFHLEKRQGGKIALKGVHGMYVSAQPDGSVQINRRAAPSGGWEEFTVEDRGNNVVCLKSCHWKYLSAQQNGTAQWNRDHAPRGGWEEIQIEQYRKTSEPILNSDSGMIRGESILVSEHSLPRYNGIYTIQNTEINGKPWFKNNSGCILYFYNANSGGGPSWSLDDRSQDGTNDWFRGGWIEPPNSGGPPLGTRSWAILETHRRFEIKIESVSIPDESSEPILNSDGRKYVFAHEHNGWHWHNERARAMGGHLASITNGIENEQITRISGGAPVWIGGIRKGSGNGPSADHWYWSDGRPWTYTNWHPGEPNNSGGGENRVHLGLQAPGTWNDVPDQWHGPAVYLVPNIASATPKSSSPEIDILAQFKSKLKVSDSHLRRIDELSSKYKKK